MNIPFPTRIGSKMGGAPTPKMVPLALNYGYVWSSTPNTHYWATVTLKACYGPEGVYDNMDVKEQIRMEPSSGRNIGGPQGLNLKTVLSMQLVSCRLQVLNTPLGLRLTSTNLQLNMQVTHVHHKLAKFPQLQGSHTS